MRFARSESWRFAESLGQLPHAALYVREALGLDVPQHPLVPPTIERPVPDRREVLDEIQRAAAGPQWLVWWRAIVADEASADRGGGEPDQLAWMRRLQADREATGAPPDFLALADRPELRQGVRAIFEEACRWTNGWRRSMLPPAAPPGFPWAILREVAEEVALDTGVGIGAVRGAALVLAVEGDWWQPCAPGVVLCSRSAALDPLLARTIVRNAFESGLGH